MKQLLRRASRHSQLLPLPSAAPAPSALPRLGGPWFQRDSDTADTAAVNSSGASMASLCTGRGRRGLRYPCICVCEEPDLLPSAGCVLVSLTGRDQEGISRRSQEVPSRFKSFQRCEKRSSSSWRKHTRCWATLTSASNTISSSAKERRRASVEPGVHRGAKPKAFRLLRHQATWTPSSSFGLCWRRWLWVGKSDPLISNGPPQQS